MAEINPSVLTFVAEKLNQLGISYAFVGGSIIGLLLDDPKLSPVRPTDDLDVVLEVATHAKYSDIENKLRKLGFSNDTRQGAPICRWQLSGLTVDIMPTEGRFMGLNTSWFSEALSLANAVKVNGVTVRVISPVAFIATKLAAFSDRGKGDFFSSHDIEDLMTVIDGRAAIVEEIASAPATLRQYVVSSIRHFYNVDRFQEALPGYLPSDYASQHRLPQLREKLAAIVSLSK